MSAIDSLADSLRAFVANPLDNAAGNAVRESARKTPPNPLLYERLRITLTSGEKKIDGRTFQAMRTMLVSENVLRTFGPTRTQPDKYEWGWRQLFSDDNGNRPVKTEAKEAKGTARPELDLDQLRDAITTATQASVQAALQHARDAKANPANPPARA